MFKFLKSKPFLLVTLVFLTFATLILVIFALRTPTARVEVLVAPTSATVEIDGKTYKNGTYDLKKGELSVHIEKDGFISQDFTFNSAESNQISTYLLQKDGTFTWYEQHSDDDLILSQIGGRKSSLKAAAYNESHPLIEILPLIEASYDNEYNYTEYRIDGGNFNGCSTDFCLKVTDTTGGNLDAAKTLLREKGVSPESYEILYEFVPIAPLN